MRTPVTVDLGGAVRPLRYDLNALAVLREQTGLNLLAPAADTNFEDPVLVRALLWAGLLHAEPGLTLQAVGAWVDFGNLTPIAEAIGQALQAATTPEVSADRSGP